MCKTFFSKSIKITQQPETLYVVDFFEKIEILFFVNL